MCMKILFEFELNIYLNDDFNNNDLLHFSGGVILQTNVSCLIQPYLVTFLLYSQMLQVNDFSTNLLTYTNTRECFSADKIDRLMFLKPGKIYNM